MPRIGAVLLVAVAALALGLPWWGGLRAERSYERYREFIQRDWPAQVQRHEYRRGWFRSHARTVFGLTREESASSHAETLGFRIEVHDEIVHGPLPLPAILRGEAALTPVLALVRSEVRFGWSDPRGDRETARIATLRADTAIGLDGRGTGRLTIPAFERVLAGDRTVKGEAIEGEFEFAPESNRFTGRLRAPALGLASQQERFEARGLEVDCIYEESEAGLPLGEASFAVQRLEAQTAGEQAPSQLEGLRIAHSQDIEGTDVHAELAVDWEALRHAGHRYGAGRAEFAVRGLHAETLARLVRASREADALDDETAAMTMKLALLQLVPALIEHARAELDVRFDTDPSPVELRARVALDEAARGGMDFSAAALTLDLEASAPVGFVEVRLAEALAARGPASGAREERLQRTLDQLRERWLIVRDEDRYVTRIRLRGGQLDVNGRSMNPAELWTPEVTPAAPEASWAPAAPAR